MREVDVGQVFQDASVIHRGMAICDLDVAPAFETHIALVNSNCHGHKDEDEDKMNLHGLSRRSSAFDEAVQADVLSAALHDHFRSYEEHTFAQKVLSPTRQGFGGHNKAKSHGSNRMVDKA